MSTTIDQRVVEMRFDNKQFESNVQTSLSSIDKLKRGLNLEGASKGLENVGAAAKNCDMSGLSGAVETVRLKFSALEVIAITALANITNSAINAGTQLLKSLTLDQVTAGFSKYEELLTHTNTIMNATGKSLEDVEVVMERLSWYTDETSYSMTDMADNIGKFTAQSIDLAVAENAMEGIANWAALSGQNASTATIAMRNFADAMGKGFMSAQDWKSIEIANMATAEFKQTAIDAAIAMGQLGANGEILSGKMKGTVVDINNFKDTLSGQASGGWFDKDAMIATLSQYGEFTEAVYQLTQETGMSCSEAMDQ